MQLRVFALCILLGATRLMAQSTDAVPTGKGTLTVHPVQHASLALTIGNTTVYADPAGGADFKNLPSPDVILVTDIHGDHFDTAAIAKVIAPNTVLVVPEAVAALLPAALKAKAVVLHNGAQTMQAGIGIKAIPMYNLGASPRHPKGRGNGYVLTIGGKQVYLSGDTQGIPEMKALKNIDVAFVCMNLPYTMDVKEAAAAVLAFKPKIVYPYHYRGQNGLSDINEFKALVNAGDKNIDVRLRNWYPGK
jgi:L-ascorbate metabolism protein UlaG (beta-lactamase superfamily)